MGSLTLNNVVSNTVLCRILAKLLMQKYGVPFQPENGQIRCLAHIVNIVVQRILFVAKLVEEDPDSMSIIIKSL